jgi:hypothetical protein
MEIGRFEKDIYMLIIKVGRISRDTRPGSVHLRDTDIAEHFRRNIMDIQHPIRTLQKCGLVDIVRKESCNIVIINTVDEIIKKRLINETIKDRQENI